MEEWEQEIITKNLHKLIKNTVCNEMLFAILRACGTLSDDDINDLNVHWNHPTKQVTAFYNLIVKRAHGYQMLLKALTETNQSGALSILTSIPLKYHGSFRYDENIILGKGPFASVFKGEYEDRSVAVKRLFCTDANETERIKNEIKIFKLCDNHENIIRCLVTIESMHFVLIVMELCDMTLKEWISADQKQIQIPQREVLRQVTGGLEWLHYLNIQYRGMRPENILIKKLLRQHKIKISGFGLSTTLEDGKGCAPSFTEVAETLGWEAPETLEPLPSENYTPTIYFASDVYSLGCLYFYVLADGRNNFGDLKDLEEAVLGEMQGSDESIQDILVIKRMISGEPGSRPSCSDLLSSPILQRNTQEENVTEEPPILRCIKKVQKYTPVKKKINEELNALKQLNSKEEMYARVFEIVKNEELSIIKGVLEGIAAELNITGVWHKDKSLLIVAVERGDYDVVEYLLNNAFEKVLSQPRFENSLVHECIQDIHEIDAEAFTQKCRILELLFTKAPQLIESRTSDYYNYTPLHVAVSREFVNGKQVEFIEILLSHNPNVNATTKYGDTPLHLLFCNPVPTNAVEIMRLLITHNANPDALNKANQTFLHYAAMYAPPSLFHEVVVYLVSIHKTNSFTVVTNDGWTVLHWAVRYMKGDPLSETLQIFKTHRVDFNALDTITGDSVMFRAIIGGRSEDFLNTLMHFGADWTITNNNQQTALHVAARWNNLSALKLLISLKADVNAKDLEGNTPLHQALSYYYDIVAELVNNGADPILKNNKQQSPIYLAKQKLKEENVEQRIVELLENASNPS